MWHLKTKQGTFWIVENFSDTVSKYHLGIDNDELGSYTEPSLAAKQVYEQETGHFQWDSYSRPQLKGGLSCWEEGEPDNW